jgi:hypothetical protein
MGKRRAPDKGVPVLLNGNGLLGMDIQFNGAVGDGLDRGGVGEGEAFVVVDQGNAQLALLGKLLERLQYLGLVIVVGLFDPCAVQKGEIHDSSPSTV